MSSNLSITDLIAEAQRGDAAAFDQIFRIAYDDLHALASARLRASSRDGVLDTTSLVHESYLRFVQAGQLKASDRQHFLNYAGRVMRSVIVDFARERLAQRRGGNALHVTLDTGIADSVTEGEEQVVRVHEALQELAQHD